MDAEARPPDDVGDDHPPGTEPAFVEKLLDERRRRFLGCIGYRSHNAVDVARKRCHDRQAGLRPEQDDLVGRRLAAQPDVGERERLLIGTAFEADARLLAHDAVHAVGADDVARPDQLAVVEGGSHTVGVLD